MIMMVIMMSVVMLILVSIEWKGSNKGLSVSLGSIAPELSSPKDTVTTDKEYDKELKHKSVRRCLWRWMFFGGKNDLTVITGSDMPASQGDYSGYLFTIAHNIIV